MKWVGFYKLLQMVLLIASMAAPPIAYAQTSKSLLENYNPFATYIGLTGSVYLPDGSPAAGAIVELLSGVAVETSTTVLADGSFGLPYSSIMVGYLTIRIRNDGCATKRYEFPHTKTFPPVHLEPMAVISGVVKSIAGRPLKGVTIAISTLTHRRGPRGEYIPVPSQNESPAAHEKTHTDAEGRFTVGALEKGHYTIQAYAAGLTSYTGETSAPVTNLEIVLSEAPGERHGVAINYNSQ